MRRYRFGLKTHISNLRKRSQAWPNLSRDSIAMAIEFTSRVQTEINIYEACKTLRQIRTLGMQISKPILWLGVFKFLSLYIESIWIWRKLRNYIAKIYFIGLIVYFKVMRIVWKFHDSSSFSIIKYRFRPVFTKLYIIPKSIQNYLPFKN